MEKKMLAIEVRVEEGGLIRMTQEDGGEGVCILVTPEQVDTLIGWLQEAKAEAEKLQHPVT